MDTLNELRRIQLQKGNFYKINREERNIAALLYSELLTDDGLKRFFQTLKLEKEDLSEAEVYFEFSMLRDLWNKLGPDQNEIKHRLLSKHLTDLKVKLPDAADPKAFNELFGARGSRDYIESPSNWSLTKMSQKLQSDDFVNACKLKWAFNAKPDLVVLLPENRALCIECKWESNESTYPTSGKDRAVWNTRTKDCKGDKNRSGGLKYIRQTNIQEHLFLNLLGYELVGKSIYTITKNVVGPNHRNCAFTWKDVFSKSLEHPSPNSRFKQEYIRSIID